MRLVKAVARSLWSTLALVIVVSCIAITTAVQGFGLRLSGGIGLYFVVWWITLFAVLPFGVRSQAESGAVISGTEPGAPDVPALREKTIWTTFAAAVVLLLAAGFLPLAGL